MKLEQAISAPRADLFTAMRRVHITLFNVRDPATVVLAGLFCSPARIWTLRRMRFDASQTKCQVTAPLAGAILMDMLRLDHKFSTPFAVRMVARIWLGGAARELAALGPFIGHGRFVAAAQKVMEAENV